MKKLLSIILMASMIVTLTPIACGGALTQNTAYADTYTCIDGIVYALSGSTATVTGWTDDIKEEVNIPATVTVNEKSYDVTIIGDYAFRGSKIKKITFAENSKLETIGKGAFYKCNISAIKATVKIPASVTRIESKAFYDCDNAKISFAENSALKYIGDYAFYMCGYNSNVYKFQSIKIPAGVESIGKDAFKKCSDLKTITFAEGSQLKDIGDGAFSECAITSITIPATVSSIGQGAFSGCGSLTSVNFDENNQNFTSDDQAIYNYDKTKLIEVYKASVTEYTIPATVTTIGKRAFYGHGSLKKITVPSSVTNIEVGTLYNCKNLSEINVDSNNINYSSDNGVLFNKDKTTIVFYPNAKEETSYSIPNTVTTIAGGAFYKNTKLETVTIPNSVTKIEDEAFYNCDKLAKVDIPVGVTTIGKGVFYDCDELAEVNISEGVAEIGGSAFGDCSKLTSITIPESVESIGDNVFYNCSALATITFGGTKEQWGALNVTLPKLETGTTTVIFKKSQTAPSAVEAKAIGYNTITLEEIASNAYGATAEYRIANGTWQDSNVFNGLTPGTEYTFEARYKAINVATGDNAGDYVASPTTSVKIKTLATVTFNSAGGTDVKAKTNLSWTDKVLDAVTNPSRTGYIFGGWKCGETEVTSETTYESLSSDTSQGITLVAQWTECTDHVYGCTKCGTAYSGSGSSSGDSGGSSDSGESGGSSVQTPTVTKTGNGTVTLSTDGSTATITPSQGYKVAKVILNDQDMGAPTTLARLKTGDKVEVTFQKSDSSGSSSSSYSGGSSGGSSVRKPTVVTPTNGKITILSDGKTAVIIPDDGYEVASVILNGEDKGTFPVLMDLKSSDKVEAKFQKSGEALNAAVNAAVSSVVKITVKSLDSMKMSSTKTAKGSIKTTLSLSKAEKSAISDLSALGYTVKYKFYRSTKKSVGYKAMKTGKTGTYINTNGKTGTRYYYKARVMVYNQTGTLVASTALKNCKYATRIK